MAGEVYANILLSQVIEEPDLDVEEECNNVDSVSAPAIRKKKKLEVLFTKFHEVTSKVNEYINIVGAVMQVTSDIINKKNGESVTLTMLLLMDDSDGYVCICFSLYIRCINSTLT